MSAGTAANLMPVSELGLDELKHLMQNVAETTERLQETHTTLQAEVIRLQNELAEANDQLRRARSLAALGEMAAGIAHEVRNPLASIRLYVQMLAEDLDDRPDQVSICDKVTRAIEGLDAIVRDVLVFARNMQAVPTRVSAEAVLDRALDACLSVLSASGATVHRQTVSPSADQAALDTELAVQALANVIRNAAEALVEASSDRREVHLRVFAQRVRRPDGARQLHTVFRVSDTGPGVDALVVDRMFNPFFTTRKTGTGLGLAIVHRIVDAHGGHISVSNRPQGGAQVDLCFPVHPVDDVVCVDISSGQDGRSTNGTIATELGI